MAGHPPTAALQDWSHRRFFELLTQVAPLRVISSCGPSTFEAIIGFSDHTFAGRLMNAITPAYHWHLDLSGFGHLRARDEQHTRSGRRVIYFELRSEPADAPFLWIYLHRERGAEFEPEREKRFAEVFPALAGGVRLEASGEARR